MASPRFTVHQYHHSVREHDAVSNHMRLIREALREVGVQGEIFAHESHLREAQTFSRSRVWNCDLFLIHHSQGNPELRDVTRIEVPKALVYHNITPPEFYKHDTYIANLCDLGKRQLMSLQQTITESFAVSRFNAWDLRTLGFSDVKLLPLLDMNGAVKPVKKTPSKTRRLLFVGKLTPHKNQALLIKTLYYLNRIHPKAELTLVGGQDPIYGDYLRNLARALEIENRVHFVGKVSDDTLTKMYETHDAFVCVSLHEGFCIPLVEAMRHGLPVFAFARAGIAQTLGSAGVRLRTKRPHWMAEIIDAALADRALLGHLAKSQAKRVRQLTVFQNKKALQKLILESLAKSRAPLATRKDYSGTLESRDSLGTNL